jgi:competence protein ComFB
MIIKNVLEHFVWQQLDEVLDRHPGVCRCEQCRADIVAYTLNHLQPHYVASEKGAVLARTQSLDYKFQIGLLVAMAAAVKQVAEHPRHE